jgi:pimeloyl-ACP methyl ester carboxylesterase
MNPMNRDFNPTFVSTQNGGTPGLMYIFWGVLLTGMLFTQHVSAQPGGDLSEDATEEEDEKKPPAPERVTLTTKDGWEISGVYYGPKPDTKPGKEVIPVIAIHGEDGNAGEFSYTATGLQTYGHATLAIDLRGHGSSTRVRLLTGETKTMKADDLIPMQLGNMFLDVEAAKKFFLDKNREGEVNIEMLAVIGAGKMGTVVAVNWAAYNWSRPQSVHVRQGRDVKALILLSPDQTYARGLTSTKALIHPAITRDLSIMIWAGRDDRSALSDAKRIYSRLEKMRPELKKAEKTEDKNLFFFEAPTLLQGTKLLARELKVNRSIVWFIETQLVRHQDRFPWSERRSVLGD